MDINITDVTFHIDKNLDAAARKELVDMLHAQTGVVTVANHEETSHLINVGYNPDQTNGKKLLDTILAKGLHAEMIGL